MTDSRAQQIAQVVRRARIERAWTQDQLADKVGVNKQTIYHIESAKHLSRQELLTKLEDVLDVDLSANSLAGQAVVDMLVTDLLTKMRRMGANDGMRLAIDAMTFIENWEPKHPNDGAGR